MTDELKKAGVCSWIAGLLIGLPVLYVASFGPACWINRGTTVGGKAMWTVYYPILFAANRSTFTDDALHWYARLGALESQAPVFRNRELIWEHPTWNALMRMRGSAWKESPTSRLAPFLSQQ